MDMDRPSSELEARIGYYFKNRSLLSRALTHSSYANEYGIAWGDNEQLEFLGDSIIGFIISEFLLRQHPKFTEGQLSKLKAHLVSSDNLFQIAARLKLGQFLKLGKGEEKTGGRLKKALLVDALEALVAAIYLDGGVKLAKEFVLRQFANDLGDIVTGQFTFKDYKSRLQEKLQSLRFPPAEYSIVRELGPDHQKCFSVQLEIGGETMAEGQGETKKNAEQEAAREVLEKLEQQEESLGVSIIGDSSKSKES